ncbi:MAG: FIST signal transduction protein [Nannocystaceae bacterium]|nr:FIST C-terminal domain-containing protein [bacterium]
MDAAHVQTALASGPEAPADLLAQLASAPSAHSPVLVCVFVSSTFSLADVLRPIQARWPDATVIGASSSGEFNERSERPQSISGWALWGDFKAEAAMAEGLRESAETVIGSLATRLNARHESHPHRVGILLLDSMSGRGEEATLLAATLLDDQAPVRLVGGAAGDDLAMQNTWVGVGEQAREDAAVVAFLHGKTPFGIGVQHGHQAESEPIKVTRAEANVVSELEGRPAWDVWRERTRPMAEAAQIDVDALEGNDLARFFFTHSASLASGSEIKVRAPLGKGDDGSLSFACGVPEGSVIRVTGSTVQRQLDSARAAAESAKAQLEGHACAGALVFDCVCRKLILGERFPQAVDAISRTLDGAPVAGFETYGEIALDVADHSGFHNSTTVVLAIPR